ncbi:hypothetical protein D7D52_34790 [Nocardia yunnanensis]|uniref:Uncharacterized protein n=2 Tax=Nocardia yunnanensis TaxID=2382165 RepID=A0A386ZN67_9NOCA|nr:hypothetical protein D7D52_34790 [Nocardia yunnanensis]
MVVMRLVDMWDVVPVAECRSRLESFYKCEEYGRTARELDRDWMATVFEWRKRVLLGNDHEDQDWRLAYLREARVRMN